MGCINEIAIYMRTTPFRRPEDFVRNAAPDAQVLSAIRRRGEALNDALIREYQRLIQQQIEL